MPPLLFIKLLEPWRCPSINEADKIIKLESFLSLWTKLENLTEPVGGRHIFVLTDQSLPIVTQTQFYLLITPVWVVQFSRWDARLQDFATFFKIHPDRLFCKLFGQNSALFEDRLLILVTNCACVSINFLKNKLGKGIVLVHLRNLLRCTRVFVNLHCLVLETVLQ